MADDGEVIEVFTADANIAPLLEKTDEMTAAVEEAGASLADVIAAAQGQVAASVSQIGAELANAGVYLDEFAAQFNQIPLAVDASGAALAMGAMALDEETMALQQAGQVASDYTDITGVMSGAIDAATMGIAAFDEAAALASVGLDEDGVAVVELTNSFTFLQGVVGAAQVVMDGFTATVEATTGTLDALTGALFSTGEAADVASGGMMNMQMALMLLATALVGALVGFDSLGIAAQNAFAQVVGMAGVTQQELAPHMQELQQIALHLGVTMQQVGQALYYVQSAGFDLASGGLSVLNAALEASKASGSQFTVVADALTSILHAYSLGATSAQSVTDMMVESVVKGKMQFSEFASSIGPLAAIGANVHMSLDEVLASLSTFTEINPHVRQDAMQLGFLFDALGLSFDAVQKRADAYNISIDQATFEHDNLIQKLEYLAKLAGGTNTLAFEKMVGGATGLKAALALLTGQGKLWNDNLSAMEGSQGALDRAFAASEQTLSAAWSHIMAALSIVAMNFINDVTPGLSKALGFVTDLLSHVASMGSAATPFITGLATAIGVVLVGAITMLVGPMLLAIAPFLLLAAAIGGVVAAVMHFRPQLEALFTAFQNNADVKIFEDQIGIIAQYLQSQLPGAIKTAQGFIAQIGGWFTQNGPAIHKFGTDVLALAQYLADHAVPAIVSLQTSLQPVGAFITGTIIPAISSFATWLLHAADFVVTHIGPALHSLQPLIGPVGNAFLHIGMILRDLGGQVLQALLPIWKQLQSSFQELAPVVMQLLPLFGQIATGLGIAFVLALATVVGVIRAIGMVITGLIQIVTGVFLVIAGIFNIFNGIVNVFTDLFTGHFEKLKGDLGSIGTGIGQIFVGLLTMIQGVWTAGWGAMQAFAAGFASTIVSIFTNLAAILVGHSIIPDMVNAVLGWFTHWFSQGLSLLTGWITSFVGWLMSLATRAQTAMGVVVSAIMFELSQLPAQAQHWISDMMNTIISTITGFLGQVGQTAQNIASTIAKFIHFTHPDEGPLASVETWMPHFGDILEGGLNANVTRLGAAAARMASSVALPTAAIGTGAGGGGGSEAAQMVMLLGQILTVLQAQGGRTAGGGGGVTSIQNTVNGVTPLSALYQLLNGLGGKSFEAGYRGAYAGTGLG